MRRGSLPYNVLRHLEKRRVEYFRPRVRRALHRLRAAEEISDTQFDDWAVRLANIERGFDAVARQLTQSNEMPARFSG